MTLMKKIWAFPNGSDSYSDSDMYNNTMTKYGLINAGFKYFTIIDKKRQINIQYQAGQITGIPTTLSLVLNMKSRMNIMLAILVQEFVKNQKQNSLL